MWRHGRCTALIHGFVLLVVASRLVGAAGAFRSGSDGEPSITGIQAKLFFDGTATFSRDVLADPDFALWNTPIGEGSAGAPSNSTLVLVEVSGPPETTEHDRQVSFTAKYKRGTVNAKGLVSTRDVLVSHTAPVGSFGKDGKAYVGFWLHGTGCSPVMLSARLVPPAGAGAAVQKAINFRCGE